MTPILDQAIPAPAAEVVSPLAGRMLFWRARYQQDSAALHHLPFLFWLVEAMRPRTAVALGLGPGPGGAVAHFGICQAVDKLDLPTRCHGIGEWPAAVSPAQAPAGPAEDASAPAEPDPGTVPADIASHNAANYAAFSVIEAMAPSTLLARLEPGTVDLVWVDAAMSAQMVDALTYAWPTKLSPQGVVLLHGIDTHFSSEAAQALLTRLKETHTTIYLPGGDGLLVVLWGPEQPARLTRLAEIAASGDTGGDDADSSGGIRQIFARLGLLNRLEWAAPQAQVRAETAEAAREAAEAVLGTVRTDHADLEKSYAVRSAAAARHQAEVFDLRTRNAQLQQKQEEMDALRQELEDLLREKTERLEIVEARSRDVVALTAMLAELHSEKTIAVATLAQAGIAPGWSAAGAQTGGTRRGLAHRVKTSRMMAPVRRVARRWKYGPDTVPVSSYNPNRGASFWQKVKRSRAMAPVRSVVRRWRAR